MLRIGISFLFFGYFFGPGQGGWVGGLVGQKKFQELVPARYTLLKKERPLNVFWNKTFGKTVVGTGATNGFQRFLANKIKWIFKI